MGGDKPPVPGVLGVRRQGGGPTLGSETTTELLTCPPGPRWSRSPPPRVGGEWPRRGTRPGLGPTSSPPVTSSSGPSPTGRSRGASGGVWAAGPPARPCRRRPCLGLFSPGGVSGSTGWVSRRGGPGGHRGGASARTPGHPTTTPTTCSRGPRPP